jgi:hypothetical protein
MPAYKNRPAMSHDTPVWRHLDLDAIVATLRDSQLRFTRVDTFDDPFERSVTKQDIDDQVPIFSSHYATQSMWAMAGGDDPDLVRQFREREDPWTKTTRIRPAKTRSAHACCWFAGEESEALWRLYCEDTLNPTAGKVRGVGVGGTVSERPSSGAGARR